MLSGKTASKLRLTHILNTTPERSRWQKMETALGHIATGSVVGSVCAAIYLYFVIFT